jgi:cytochrome b561
MNWKNSTDRYGTLSIGMHWLMFLLIVAVYACIDLREFFPKDSDPRNALKMWHFMLGLSVFALVWLRLIMRVTQVTPRIEPALKAKQELAAKLVHIALYVLMIGMPLLGWIILSAAGKPIPFFGFDLPALVAENREFAKSIKEIHEVIGTAGYFLIGIHAAAALFHHYIMRDNTLARMLPNKE